jgi:hypothetical protein
MLKSLTKLKEINTKIHPHDNHIIIIRLLMLSQKQGRAYTQ